MQNWPEDQENGVEFRYLCGNVDHSGALEEAGVCEADAIIIGPAEDLPDNEVCAQAGFNQPEQPYKDAVCNYCMAMSSKGPGYKEPNTKWEIKQLTTAQKLSSQINPPSNLPWNLKQSQ